MGNEATKSERRKRPGYLTAYAKYAGISKPAAAEQLKRVGIDYMLPFDFHEADKLRAAMRHADREPYSKPIYIGAGESPRDPGGADGPGETDPDDERPSKSPAFAQHQAKKEKFRAKLAELDFLERSGDLVRKALVEQDAFRLGRQIRDAILNVPARLAGILAAETDQRAVHDLLEKELRQALEALIQDLEAFIMNE